MGAKKNQKAGGGEQKKSDGGKKDGSGGDTKISVILKADLHCEGCASKLVKIIRAYDGVEDVKVDSATSKVTVTGKVDPTALREKVEAKTHKPVVLVSPQPPSKGGDKVKDGGDGGEKAKKKDNNKDGDSKENKGEDDNKKAKEKEKAAPVVKTTVLKINLHCEGCIQKIQKIVNKTKGCHEMKLDKQKELVTVTGSMDVKALCENLKKHLKREVEIVPPKKEGGEKKEKGGDGAGGNEKAEKEKGKGGKKEGGGGGGGEKSVEEVNRMQVQVGYPYMYGSGYVQDPMYYHYPPAPQMFSDENPNACSVM
ncbi:unnamed protein product [Cuscuta europaea]|uniref:HMA domain-containing protein n=1 Tax=Cuscuta europaea TaxID=41803 RepID=A0A9P0ZCN4_CUSEU|nr:unnamed protein product [Cuscuta europaea]